MDDSKLLELAGRAASETYTAEHNPLERDDLALRLAVKLGMEVYVDTHTDGCECTEAYSVTLDMDMKRRVIVNHGSDPYAATRRAITLVAAEIGKETK